MAPYNREDPYGGANTGDNEPDRGGRLHGRVPEEPGLEYGMPDAHGRGALATYGDVVGESAGIALGGVVGAARLLGPGLATVFAVLLPHRDDHPAMSMEDIDMMAVEAESTLSHTSLAVPVAARPAARSKS